MPRNDEKYSPMGGFDTRVQFKDIPNTDNIVPEELDTQSDRREFDIPVEFTDV
jgi:hypothetical protein